MIDFTCGDVNLELPKYPENTFDACLTDPPYGLGFMGKSWDHGVPSAETWREVLRVLKPGAMLMAFGGTRTWHRLACAIEDAGFELRDTMMWLYGSGFPKSLDILKAIDKAAGAEREKVKATGGLTKNRNLNDDRWCKIGDAEALMDSLTPITPAACLWSGYGTALKPAWEPILLAMKSCEGTFVENALKWGVAGLGIDGGRIGVEGGCRSDKPYTGGDSKNDYGKGLNDQRSPNVDGLGRWPANLILDEEAAPGQEWTRYFYCPKASRKERGEGNGHPTVKPLSLCTYLARLILPPPRDLPRCILVPFSGSGSEALGCERAGWDLVVGIEKDLSYVEIAKGRAGRVD